jgi:hypothetical protein
MNADQLPKGWYRINRTWRDGNRLMANITSRCWCGDDPDKKPYAYLFTGDVGISKGWLDGKLRRVNFGPGVGFDDELMALATQALRA